MNTEELQVLSYIDEHRHELFELLSALVRIDTQNFKTHGNENAGQAFLEQACRGLGLSVERFTPASVPGLTEHADYRPDRGADAREDLVAVYRGRQDVNGVMLAAHIDTMPLGDPAPWDDDPLSGLIKDGRVYGRGAGDDKMGIAVSWFIIKALKACGIRPEKNVLLGSYADEEYGGGNGALGLALKYPCECYINLDTPGFENEACGGGCYAIELQSLRKDTVIASVFNVFHAADVIVTALEKLQRPGTQVLLNGYSGGDGGEQAGIVKFSLYTDMSKTQAQATLDALRTQLQPQLQALDVAAGDFVLRTRYFGYGVMPSDSRRGSRMADIVEEFSGSRPTGAGTCLTDLSVFMNAGSTDSFNFGIPTGDETGGGAHQANEFVDCDALVQLAKQIALFLLRGEV